MIELTFLKELIIIKQKLKNSVMFVAISIFLEKGFKFQSYVCNDCHDVLMMSINLNDIAILNIINADYCCTISGIRKGEAVNLLEPLDLTEKGGTVALAGQQHKNKAPEVK